MRSARHALRALYFGLSAAALGAAIPASGGCTNTSTATLYTPITGIVIRSSDLVAGHGCGTGPDQVYAYVAVLAHAVSPGVPYTSIVVPCYTDGVLSNLQPAIVTDDAGNSFDLLDYKLYIFAYNSRSFPASLACTPPQLTGNCPGDQPDASARAAAVDGGTILPIHPPNWTTTCTAIEQQGIPVLADCEPLEPAAGASGDAGAFDGGMTDAGAADSGGADGAATDGAASNADASDATDAGGG